MKIIVEKLQGKMYIVFPKADYMEATIGRALDNTIVIEDNCASRHHGKFSVIQGCLIYEDNSTNGTYVDGKKLSKYEWSAIQDFTSMKIGETDICIRCI